MTASSFTGTLTFSAGVNPDGGADDEQLTNNFASAQISVVSPPPPTPTPLPTPVPTRTLEVTVLNGETPLSGVEVNAGSFGTAVTNKDGKALIPELPVGAAYSLTPLLTGFSFTPASLIGVVSSANQVPSFTATPLITPFFECIEERGATERIAHFGYQSSSQLPINIPVGDYNQLYGSASLPPTEFLAGPRIEQRAFSIPAPSTEVAWSLAGTTAQSVQTRVCPGVSTPTCPAPEVVDRCGVCGGDGTSCLPCSLTDLEPLQEQLLEQGTEYLTSILKEIRDQAKQKKITTKAGKISIRRASESLGGLRLQVASMPSPVRSCNQTRYCSEVSLTPSLSAIQDALRNLRRLDRRFSPRITPLQPKQRARTRPVSRAALFAGLGQSIKLLPPSYHRCR